jgi:transcriptional regulator with XRE-family HTH domain
MPEKPELTLGQLLRDLRLAKGFSLREVERRTGISNPYLSQLENGQIQKPAPHVLHKLAELYGVEYQYLMQKAGYLIPDDKSQSGKRGSRFFATSAIKDLTDVEEEALLDYLAFLRTRKRRS